MSSVSFPKNISNQYIPTSQAKKHPQTQLLQERAPIDNTPIQPMSFVKFCGTVFSSVEQKLLASLPKADKPTQIVMVTDPGFDVDDETAMVVAASLQKRGLIDLKAVVATTVPSPGRALLAKGVLNELGIKNVPVAIGDDHTPPGFSPEAHRLQADFLPAESTIETNAQNTLKNTLQSADDKSLTLLLIAGMGDVAKIMKSDEALFQQKVKNIVIMGGVDQQSEAEDTSEAQLKLKDGLLAANTIATNNRHNQDASNYVYEQAQKLGIPLKVVTRKAATATPISPDFFKELAESAHPVANHLRQIEGDFLNKFWQAAYNQKMGPGRDKSWFIKTFCKPGTPETLEVGDEIRPYLKSRVLYDAIALLACVDGLARQFFTPTRVQTNGQTQEIIGLSDKANGLQNPEQLATMLSALSKDGLQKA